MDAVSLEDLLTFRVSEPRRRFVAHAHAQLGKPYLWGAKGPDAYDCSGLVTDSLRAAGGPDLRPTHNAQKLYIEASPVADGVLAPGDLVFYGMSPQAVSHVVILCAGGKVFSASRGDRTVTTLAIAQQRGAKVVCHPTMLYRRDVVGTRRNVWLAALERQETNG